jgi:hypothetical protein
LRNRACFEGKLIISPIELICYSVVYMKYWAGLNSSAYQELIRRGADELINTGMSAHVATHTALRIEGVRIPTDAQGPDARNNVQGFYDGNEDAGSQ